MNSSKLIMSCVGLMLLFPTWGQASTLEADSPARRVIDYFNHYHIEVRVLPPAFPALVGELDFFQKLTPVWSLLDRNKEEIRKRTEGVEVISLSTYGTVNFVSGILTLDVNFTEETLRRYLGLVEKKREIFQTFEISLQTGSIDLHSPEPEDFTRLTDILDFFLARRIAIKNLSGIINEISVGGTSEYLMLEHGKMSLPEIGFEESFDRYEALLKRAGRLFRVDRKTQTEIRLGFNLDREEERIEFEQVIETLEQDRPAVRRLMSSERIRRIQIDYGQDDNAFDRDLSVLRLATRGPGISQMTTHLTAIVEELNILDQLAIPLTSASDRVDTDYINAISKIQKFRFEIEAKSEVIREIRLTPYRTTQMRYGTLYVNSREEDRILANVLDNIKI